MADAYFRCYPSDFLHGVLGMEPDEIAAYTVILMLIYDRGAPVVEDLSSLAWRCRINTRRFKAVIDRLVDLGKLERTEFGELTNERAEKELLRRTEASEKGAQSARDRWSLRDKKHNENNVRNDANALPSQCLPEVEVNNIRNLTVSCPKPAKPARTKGSYPDDFEVFWKGYPTDPCMAKKTAFAEWKKLEPEDKQAASDSIPTFRAYCASKPDYRPVHACRYLSERRFEGFVQVARQNASKHKIYRDSQQGAAWAVEYRRRHGKSVPWDNYGFWVFETEWPPGHEQRGAA